jgi:PAS domain S-box-containing protein
MAKKNESKISKPQSLRVLMVEDSEDDMLLIIRELKKGGYNPEHERVETAAAMKKALKDKQWDVILCDYKLPKFNAPSAIAVLKETNIDIPLIIVSGAIGEETAAECMRLGAYDYIMKNNLSRLCPAITRELKEAEVRVQRKRTEKALKKSENKYRLLADNVSDVIFVLDMNLNYTYISPSVKILRGYEPEEVLKLSYTETLTPSSLELAMKTLADIMELEKIKHGEITESRTLQLEMRRKDGTTVWTEVKFSFIRDEKQVPVGILGLTRDITERKLVEEELKESENRYRLSFENVTDVIYIIDTNLNIISMSPSVERILGYKPEDFIGHPVSDLGNILAPESFNQAVADVVPVLKGKTIPVKVYEFIAKNGTIKYGEVSGSPIMREGRVIGIISVARDITERELADEALRALTSRQDAILAAVPEIIIEVNNNMVYTWANSGGFEFFGDDVIGKEAAFYFEGEQETYDTVSPLFKGVENIIYLESWQRRKDGEKRLLAWWCRALKDKSGQVTGALSSARDITDRKRAEEELRQSFEKLRKALGATVNAISLTVEMKDPYTSGHQQRVSDLARAIATEMGLSADRQDFILTASSIHDIGKIALPAEILSKPTKLTELEFSLIKTHAQIGYDILKDIEFPWPVADVVLQHHERMNGSGYPNGLKGENILLEARILAIADVVEAIASHRPYRPALGIDLALEDISGNKDILYDADAVDACLRLFREKGYTLALKNT